MSKLKRLFISSFLLVFTFFSVFTLKSFADQYVVKPSITMTSSNTSFSDNESGSWQMTKSAKWIAKNKAQIKFELESKAKYGDNNMDVLFVLDNSGSMAGDPLAKIKSDASDAIDTILSNSNNRISLVTFSSSSQVLSNWSSNAVDLKNLVNGIDGTYTTNYYAGLKSAEAVLDGTAIDASGTSGSPYQKQAGRDLIMIFMSDGQPNEQTPNEVAEYNFIKQLYPYITINAIQYNMGEDFILEPLKVISDNQYISNSNTTNNTLLEASVVSFTYDKFILTDLLHDGYWDGATIDKVIQILGEATSTNTGTLNPTNVTVDTSATTPTIKWDLSGIYRSGTKATLTLEVTLKDEYKDQGGLYPTNKGTTIETSLKDNDGNPVPDVPDEDVSTTDTPVLSSDYIVHYDANKPTSCTLGGDSIPQDSNHIVFSTVEIDDGIPTCTDPNNSQNNYEFKGWEIVEPATFTKLGDDYFAMPEADVTLKAIWTRPAIAKIMDGTIYEEHPAYFDTGQNVNQKMKRLAGDSSATYNSTNTNIKSIKAADSLPAGFTPTSDNTVSASGSPLPIYMWFDNANDQGIIYYYTDADLDKIFLNTNSSRIFYLCSSLTDITPLANWNASRVTNMRSMFYKCTSLTDITPIANWDTSSVINATWMFAYCSSLTDVAGLYSWDTSSVTDMTDMFYDCSSLADLTGISSWDVSSVTAMHGMFHNCRSISDLAPISNWNISSVTDTAWMFANCVSLTNLTSLSSWNTSNVTNMFTMFAGCASLTNLSGLADWNTSNVTNMSTMFARCASLTNLSPLANWNTSNVTDMSVMFSSCTSLADLSPLANWNTSNVTNMSDMFNTCSSLADLSPLANWNTSSVTDMSYMFYNDNNIDATVLNGWDVSNVTKKTNAFTCPANMRPSWY